METEAVEDQNLKSIKEGKADALHPKSVFYNPVQEFNRDLTIAVITELAKDKLRESEIVKIETDENKDGCEPDKSTTDSNGDVQMDEDTRPVPGVKYENGIRILEGLAASGLRSMRFGLELAGVKEIITNDFDKPAVEIIEKNIERNNLQNLVKASYGDASMIMYQNKGQTDRFDVIDVDPYGSPSQFFDSAVQAVKDDGILCVTCTDMAVLCGNSGETCNSKYGAMSIKTKYCHEMALRILLQCIESHANRYSRYIEPVISLSVDFYIRVFVKLHTGQKKVKESITKLSMIYHCVGCGAFTLQKLGLKVPTKGDNYRFTPAYGPPVQPNCEHCGSRHMLGGPIWSDPIHNTQFIQQVIDNVSKNMTYLKTSGRIIGMLTVAKEELQDVPLFYVLDDLCNIVHCAPPSMKMFRSTFLNAGYRVSLSHAAKNSYKTDAPIRFIWDVMRTWVKDHPVKSNRLTPGSVAKIILDKPTTHDVSFTLHPDANPESRDQGLIRWQPNPEPEWGPKPRPKKSCDDETDRREKFQGKRKQKQSSVDHKQYPCKRYKAGECEYGDECIYNHNIEKFQK
ncbi:hypothetical protein SNE40_012059 [Patella caerulea]|uniref:tRNA (guanine(26)-N(2))-dimethyltransferase n=1 Tax=Patella caerulea TaxID=87958 RepID=A0AAN8PZ23_PATCE